MNRSYEGGFSQGEVINEYQYFSNRHERNDIYRFSKELASYLYEANIKNILFLDRSSRPAWVGVDEYWNQQFSDTDKPGFYFINPDGLKASTPGLIINPQEVESIFSELLKTGKVLPYRSEQDIKDRFSDVYPGLMKDITKPIVVFDTCAHTGETMRQVLHLLDDVGFTDVRVVTANEPDFDSGIEPDTLIDMGTKLTSCYPFGRDSLVKKGHV